VADHTEVVTGYQGGVLFTIGGNSGPSNVDGFGGQGGVHRHRWDAPAGQGNGQVLVVADTAKVVTFGGPARLTRAGTAPPAQPRMLMLKSPVMTGADVRAVQQALNQRNHAGLAADGAYGPATLSSTGNDTRTPKRTASSARRPDPRWACRHDKLSTNWPGEPLPVRSKERSFYSERSMVFACSNDAAPVTEGNPWRETRIRTSVMTPGTAVTLPAARTVSGTAPRTSRPLRAARHASRVR
jgi:hypothetical protein